MKTPTVQLWSRVTPKTHRDLDRVARRNGLTRAAMIAKLIEQAIQADDAARAEKEA